MKTAELLELHDELTQAAKAIMSAKNHDYTGAAGDPFANFRGSESLGVDPIVGILLRMQDKMQRIRTFAAKGELHVKGEGVRDAILDILNYAVLAAGLIEDSSPTDHSLTFTNCRSLNIQENTVP